MSKCLTENFPLTSYLPLIEKDRREEWLGYYNEDLREIIYIYPKWFVWIIILMQAGIRIVSALKINLQEIIIDVLKPIFRTSFEKVKIK